MLLDSRIFKILARFTKLGDVLPGKYENLNQLWVRDFEVHATNTHIDAIVSTPEDMGTECLIDPLRVSGQLSLEPEEVDLSYGKVEGAAGFPDIEEIFPTGAAVDIAVDPRLLKTICELAIAVNEASGNQSVMQIRIRGSNIPLEITTHGDYGEHDEYHMKALLHPLISNEITSWTVEELQASTGS